MNEKCTSHLSNNNNNQQQTSDSLYVVKLAFEDNFTLRLIYRGPDRGYTKDAMLRNGIKRDSQHFFFQSTYGLVSRSRLLKVAETRQ